MIPPSLTRVKILKFMLTRIDEPLTESEIMEGSHSTYTIMMKELQKLRKEKMITQVGKKYKLSFYDADFITKVHTELAMVCDFRKILKKVMKKIDKRK